MPMRVTGSPSVTGRTLAVVTSRLGLTPVTGSPGHPSPSDWHTRMGEFAAVVRRFMKERGLSLRETARATGYSDHTFVSKVLNGHKPLSPYGAACLDDALQA